MKTSGHFKSQQSTLLILVLMKVQYFCEFTIKLLSFECMVFGVVFGTILGQFLHLHTST